MKKIQLLLVILVIISNPIFSSLIDYYKKGTIKLEQTSNFGKDVDWENIFYQANKDLLVVEDGTINNEFGEMFFPRTGDGNLLVGASSNPDIRILSTTGKLLRTFKLQMNLKDFFPGTFPYYREILVAGEGNILIFKTSTCIIDGNVVFQVYTPAGQYVCETTLEKGKYDFTIDRRYKNIAFTKKAIYGLFQLKGTEEISLRLVKIEVN